MTGPVPEPEPEPDAALAAAAGLAASLSAMTAQMGRLTRSQKWYRRIAVILAVSFCADLAITGGLAYNTIRQNSIQHSISATQDALRASDVRQCQLANVTRQQDIAIWNALLRVPASATAAQKAEVADLERLVRVKDAPRDCNAAYNK